MTSFDFILNFPREISLVDKIPAFVASLAESKFQPVISTPGMIVYAAGPNDQIGVNPAQYRFTVQRQVSLEEVKELLAYVPASLDTLVSEDMTGLVYNLHMVDIRQVHGKSTFEITKKFASNLSESLKNPVGAGFRFLFESAGLPAMYDEFKCEPLLRDPSYFFFERFANFDYLKNKDVAGTAAAAYPVFEEYVAAAYDTLIKG